MMKRARGLFCLTVALLFASAAPTYGQDSGDSVLDALRELTKEVRLLRQTMETATIASTRSQLVVERLRMQHDVVESIRRQLTETRDALATVGEEIGRIEDYQENADAELDSEYDPERRKMMERQIAMIENQMNVIRGRKSQLETQQSQLQARLAEEEARVDEIRDQLESLEAELERLMTRDE